jgi:hypothetical protein
MNRVLGFMAFGIVNILAGAALLLNLDSVANLDQRCGARFNAWLKERFGNLRMNRDIYSSGGNVSGLRKSRIVFRVIGVVLILYGLAVAAISFRLLLLLEQSSRGSH